MNIPLHLFEGFGVELEYMIVDQQTLAIKPISDRLIQKVAGKILNEVQFGEIAWSNELVLHVLELKTNGPAKNLAELPQHFQDNVTKINDILSDMGAKLLPTGMHPLMQPDRDTVLWPHDSKELYATFDRIFSCQGHGWSNLQSTHLNLPFANDEEFSKLHMAIRLLLPILPALTASTPVVEGQLTGYQDNRLLYYKNNQNKIPSISGLIIPEVIYSKAEYEEIIFKKMYRDISPYDPQGVMQHEWLNSRGACARFSRQTIEIRVLDSQECVLSEIALLCLIVSVLKAMVAGKWLDLAAQANYSCEDLSLLWEKVIKQGGNVVLDASDPYLKVFGCAKQETTITKVWQHIISSLEPLPEPFHSVINILINQGNLSTRISQQLEKNPTAEHIVHVYQQLADCLAYNQILQPSYQCTKMVV